MSNAQGDGAAGAKAYCWTFGNAEFDEARWQLRVAGQVAELERKPLEVLQYLLRHAGEVVTKEELLSACWAGRFVVDAVLTNAVGKVRKVLGDDAQDIVATLPKVGYRLAVPVARKVVEFIPAASQLEVGSVVPRRPNWRLETPLARTEGNEVWLARHAKTRETRVFKFSLAGKGLNGLKREVTIARLLREALGEREDFVPVIDWDFEEAPFFVESDYGGVSLDRWPEHGDIKDVPIERRLALFVAAAEAVAAAHSIGVLHKDLKPANLLMEGEGESARLRVADFGSSRLFDSGRLDELGITHLGLTQTQAISQDSGTPLYLAPEVVGGQSASVKSDVYALGVTLYQLLIGDFRRPLSPGWEADIADPLLREDIADAANGDPTKRLDSAAALAERIRTRDARREKRALELAVQARVADGEKRLAKVRARRPWMIAAMVALSGAVGIMGWLLPRAWESERDAQSQRDIALAMNRFVNEDILGAASRLDTGQATLTMREALERAAPKIDRRFSSQPELAAPLHATVARAYYQLSDYASAARHHGLSKRLFSQSAGLNSADSIDQQSLYAESLARAGALQDAKNELAGLRGRIEKLAPDRRPRSKIHYDRALAWTQWQSGDMADAVPILEDALTNLALLPEPDPSLEMEVNQALLMARAMAGLPTANLVKVQEAAIRKIQSSHDNEKMPLSVSARYGLLRVRMLAGEERSLEADYRKMIAELVDMLGPRNEHTLLAMHGLASIYSKQERWAECRDLARRVGMGLTDLLGPSHIQTVNAMNSRGVCLMGAGQLDDAEAQFLSSLNGIKGDDGIKATFVRTAVQINLGHVYAGLGKWDQLEALIPDIRTKGSKLLKADSDALGEVELIEGQLLAARGNVDKARSKLQSGLKELGKKNPPDYWLAKIGRQALSGLMGGTAATK